MNEHLENYEYSKNSFSKELRGELKVVFPTCHGFTQYKLGKIVVHFPLGTKLSSSDQAKLGEIVASHVAVAPRDFKAEIAAVFTTEEKLNIVLEKWGLK